MATDVSKTTFPIQVQWTHPAMPPIAIEVEKTYEVINKDESTYVVNNIEFDVTVFKQVFNEVAKTITDDLLKSK